MQTNEILPDAHRRTPKVYAYSDTSFPGQLKVGYTTQELVEKRIGQQHPIKTPWKTEKLQWWDEAFYDDGSGTAFSDHDLHRYLKQMGKENTAGEWYVCTVEDVKAAYVALRQHREVSMSRTLDFKMRPEQQRAVEMTAQYFDRIDREQEGRVAKRVPHFLWNAKMRFGKTFATYQLAKRMGARRVLVLTFKPAVEEAWHDDLMGHVDFEGWQFFSSQGDGDPNELDKSRPIVCFGSFQDYLGLDRTGNIKSKNEWVHGINWDLVVLDEYHFGAWNEHARALLDIGDEAAKRDIMEQNELLREDGFDVSMGNGFEEGIMPITGYHYLYLSGTPFRALQSGEFTEEQIFNWTYQDEQQSKREWEGARNPYAEMPTMVMMTYQMPDDLGRLTEQYDMNEFDLNEFFKAEGIGEEARFVHEKAVQKWLDIIHGDMSIFNHNDDPHNQLPALPYDDVRLLEICNHTMWFMYSVASCDAMENLLRSAANNFYHTRYAIVNCSGPRAGIGLEALRPVRQAMGDNPIETRTIVLTCGKLTTGVTIKPLSGIFMLRNCSSPETYFQAAFRVQSPWTVPSEDDPMRRDILKTTCYVFDFAPNRALREVVEYANRLSLDATATATKKVDDFINFLPILQFDGASMKMVDATEILDFVDNGTTATLLARRWNSATLVDVSTATIEKILANPDAYAAIMKIEGFRAMGEQVLETIVNRSKDIEKMKRESDGTSKAKKEIDQKTKERNTLRKQVQEKLMKFATRIPIFMYLTDYREESLTDIIRKLEPLLFRRVTGLTIDDFELLVSVGVFNDAQMNDAILKFRRYEDSSLVYTGVNRHEQDEYVGTWSGRVMRSDVVVAKRR